MQGKVEKVEQKTGKSDKVFYSVTISGNKGNSFDEKFVGSEGRSVEYETVTNDKGYTNHVLVKFLDGGVSVPEARGNQQTSPPSSPKQVTAGEIKLIFIPEALKCAINGAKLTCKDGTITSDQIMKVADAYLGWMVAKALEG